MVTDRWLQFRGEAHRGNFGDGKARTGVFIDVMTDGNGKPRKLCELCISLEDLHAAVSNVKVIDEYRR
jgi:hypothetical protein